MNIEQARTVKVGDMIRVTSELEPGAYKVLETDFEDTDMPLSVADGERDYWPSLKNMELIPAAPFKVGDTVMSNGKRAYHITKQGVECTVAAVFHRDGSMEVTVSDRPCRYSVAMDEFDLVVKPEVKGIAVGDTVVGTESITKGCSRFYPGEVFQVIRLSSTGGCFLERLTDGEKGYVYSFRLELYVAPEEEAPLPDLTQLLVAQTEAQAAFNLADAALSSAKIAYRDAQREVRDSCSS